VHFARNLLATVPKSQQEMVAAAFRTGFAYSSSEEMAKHYDQVAGTFAEHFAKASALMAGAKEEILAFSAFPREQWRQTLFDKPVGKVEQRAQAQVPGRGHFPQ
jgi:putative transposase